MPPSSRNRLDAFHSLCRVCARDDPNAIPIFGEEGKRQNIPKKIKICLPVNIHESDIFPKQICLTCLTKLDSFWDYTVLCKEAQVKIEKKIIKNQENFRQENCTPPPEDIRCGVCRIDVTENGVGCEGLCRKWYHIRCIKMSREVYDRLCNNSKESWICKKCRKKVPLPIISRLEGAPIEEKLRNLTECYPISYGESAVICLAPEATPPPSSGLPPPTREAQVAAGSTEPVMVPVTYLTPASAPSAAPAAPPPVAEDVYPQSLIQVPQNPGVEQPVVYQNRSVPAPVSVPAPASAPAPQPVPRRRQIPKPVTTSSTPQRATPTPVKRQNGETPNGPQAKKHCRYCNKYFTDDIIDHHISLHLRQTFRTCLDCNKNFRSEEAMERHRCGNNEPIDLDADDETIVL